MHPIRELISSRRHWIKKGFCRDIGNDEHGFCLLGAARKAGCEDHRKATGQDILYHSVYRYIDKRTQELQDAIKKVSNNTPVRTESDIIAFNDRSEWSVIDAVLNALPEDVPS